MGMENFLIPDGHISASSSKEGSEAHNARLSGLNSWSPRDDDTSPYLEIKLDAIKRITSIVTQVGSNGEMVKRFSLQYKSASSREFEYVMNNVEGQETAVNSDKVAELTGNSNDQKIKETVLSTPIITDTLRIRPIRESADEAISLRVELRGCDEVSTNTAYVLETTTTTIVQTTSLPTAGSEITVVETNTTEVSRSTPVNESSTLAIVVTTTTGSVANMTTKSALTPGAEILL